MKVILISLLIILGVIAQRTVAQQSAQPLLISDVRVFDGERVLEHRGVLIENGRITRIGGADLKDSRAEVIDGRGRTLLPGLIDAHVHVSNDAISSLHQALALGVTTVFDMFTSFETLKKLKQIEANDPPNVADVRTAGIGATAPGGHPSEMGGPPFPTINGPEQAQAFVDARIAEGSDYIKIIYDDLSWAMAGKGVPMITKEMLKALVQAAHQRGKLAVVHIHSERQARDAIEVGADGLAHVFMGTSASEDFGKFAAHHHVFIITTLSALYSTCGMSDGAALLSDTHFQPFITSDWRGGLTATWHPLSQPDCKGTEDGMRELNSMHVQVLAGTDAPVPGVTYGASLHGELVRLVQLGYTPTQALTSATSIPARIFHLTDRGSIRPGQRADLLLVEGDPTKDILATHNIVAVFKRGIRVKR